MKTSLGIWALGPMVTRFVPGGYKPQFAGETTADGSVSLETRNDVGAGAISPAIRVDTLVYGPLTTDKALHIVDERRKASARSAAATAGAAS